MSERQGGVAWHVYDVNRMWTIPCKNFKDEPFYKAESITPAIDTYFLQKIKGRGFKYSACLNNDSITAVMGHLPTGETFGVYNKNADATCDRSVRSQSILEEYTLLNPRTRFIELDLGSIDIYRKLSDWTSSYLSFLVCETENLSGYRVYVSVGNDSSKTIETTAVYECTECDIGSYRVVEPRKGDLPNLLDSGESYKYITFLGENIKDILSGVRAGKKILYSVHFPLELAPKDNEFEEKNASPLQKLKKACALIFTQVSCENIEERASYILLGSRPTSPSIQLIESIING